MIIAIDAVFVGTFSQSSAGEISWPSPVNFAGKKSLFLKSGLDIVNIIIPL
jgi:hypothetical protein